MPQGAGRTDAGVHAEGQVAHVALDTRLGPAALCRALDALLPRDVAVRRVIAVPDAFHARRDARAKRYCYRLWTGATRSPLRDRRSLWVRAALDVAAMQAAAQHLLGTHDFTSFRAAGSAVPSSVRTVTKADVTGVCGDEVRLDFEASGFLRYMVRSLVGSLLEVGRGRRPPDVDRVADRAARPQRGGPDGPSTGAHAGRRPVRFPARIRGFGARTG